MDAPLNLSESNLRSSLPLQNHCNSLTKLDKRAIAFVQKILNDKLETGLLTGSLTHTANWKNSIVKLIDIKNKENLSLTNQGIIEVVKLLITSFPILITKNIEYSGISDQEGLAEIAKLSAKFSPKMFLNSIEYFGIQDHKKLIEICTSCIEKNATKVLKILRRFKIREEELLNILERASEFRPDLTLKTLNYFEISDRVFVDKLIIKCLEAVPYMLLVSWQIKIWLKDHPEIFLNPSLPLNKIIAAQVAPVEEMQTIFNLFKKFATNPEQELVARVYWLRYHQNKKRKIDNSKLIYKLNNLRQRNKLALISQCGMTTDALTCAIFGVDGLQAVSKTWKQQQLNVSIVNTFWIVIKENEERLSSESPFQFFAYTISSEKIDHSFLLIQHKNEAQKIVYRILQSWVDRHDLEDYMNNRDLDINSEQFEEFTQEMTHILLDNVVSYKREIFYEQYFMTKPNYQPFVRDQLVKFEWGSSNLENIWYHQAKFESFKAKHMVKITK